MDLLSILHLGGKISATLFLVGTPLLIVGAFSAAYSDQYSPLPKWVVVTFFAGAGAVLCSVAFAFIIAFFFIWSN